MQATGTDQNAISQREAAPCLVPVDFESRAFGFRFYRVTRCDEERLGAELKAIAGERPMAVDAKAPADDVATGHALMRLGFRKVCMQIVLRHDLAGSEAVPVPEVGFADRLDLDEETLRAHARNFTRDRFSLDPLLPAAGRHSLYYQWFSNSLGGARKVAHIGPHVCTFSRQGGEVVVDLVSILEPRRGYGSRLMSALVAHARRTEATSVRVTTECENTAAWTLYQRCGFVPVKYTSVYHLVVTP